MSEPTTKNNVPLLCGVLLVALSLLGLQMQVEYSGWVLFVGLAMCFNAA